MSQEANKAMVRRSFEEQWNAGNLDIIDELFILDDPGGRKAWVQSVLDLFSEATLTTGEAIAEGDRVAQPWSVRGVLQHDLDGVGSPGERVEYSGVGLFRVVDGKLLEEGVFTEGFGTVLLGQTYQAAEAAR